MAYSLGQAAKAAGISKTSLHRAIMKGRVSATKKEDGAYEIDPAELHRVYPIVGEANGSANPEMGQNGTPDPLAGIEELCREIEPLREMLAGKDDVIDDLRRRLDQSEQERRDKDRQITALLAPPRSAETPPRGFLTWFIRRNRGA